MSAPISRAALACALLVAGCAGRPAQHPAPTPSPAATRRHVPARRVAAVPRETARPTPVPATPVAATAPPAPLVAPPDAPPHILSVEIEPRVIGSGDTITGRVVASSNVASVEARLGGYGVNMTKVAPGTFAMRYTTGDIPFFLHRTYTIDVIARNARGDTDTREIPITVR